MRVWPGPILLPMDLAQPGTLAADGTKGEPRAPPELSGRAAQVIGRSIRVVEKPGQMHVEAGRLGPQDMVTCEGESRVLTGLLQAVQSNQIILAPPEMRTRATAKDSTRRVRRTAGPGVYRGRMKRQVERRIERDGDQAGPLERWDNCRMSHTGSLA